MTFLSPLWLLLLGVVALLAGVYLVAQRRRPQYALRFTALELLESVAPRRPGWRRHLPATLLLATLIFLVVGLARPAYQTETDQMDSTVVLAVDVSPSMMATDIEPTRFEALGQAVDEFLEQVPEEARVGLVSFAEEAQVETPPTTDRQLVRQNLAALEYRSHTAVGDALVASLQVLQTTRGGADDSRIEEASGTRAERTGSPGRVVLLSDGESNAGSSVEKAAERVASTGVVVDTIAFGTADGQVELADGPVDVPVATHEMELVADATGGEFFEAPSAEAIERVYTGIGESFATRQTTRELSPWLFAGGFVLIAAAALASMKWFSRLP